MYYFTKEGFEKLQQDFEELEKNYFRSLKANSMDKDNKINESGSFLHTRNELFNKFMKLKKEYLDQYNNAIIIEETDEYKNWDGLNIIKKCEVVLNWDGDVETYKILGFNEVSPDNEDVISCESPLAKELLGHKIGDVIRFMDSEITILDIKSIEKAKVLKK